MKEQIEGKSNLEIAKEVIKQNIGEAQHGIFCTRNWIGDPMFTIYSRVGLTIDICYAYEYFEVFGLTHDEFKQLESFYYTQREKERE